jgi:acyl-CoA reductase-like NAD-dependent aldehyde dehydrogenase
MLLPQVVPTALRGCFQSCGQNCAGVERLIVHRAVYDEFVKQFVEVVENMRQVRPVMQQSYADMLHTSKPSR